jgi:Acetyltransferase (GNAT) domain
MTNLTQNVAMDKPLQLRPTRIENSEFDALVANFDGAVLEMSVAFAASRWPSVILEPWVYYHDDEIIAAVLVMVKPLPLHAGNLAVVKWGPILKSETGSSSKEYLKLAVAHLDAEYATRRKMMLSIMARAEKQPSIEALDTLMNLGFKVGEGLPYPNRYLIDVSLSDESQRKSFSQKWRYHLNKSEKNNLVFEVAASADFPRFDKLYQSMSERKKFPDFSAYDTVHLLFEYTQPELRPQLFFVTCEGRDIAGAVIYKLGKTAVYLYGATNDEALPLRAGYFLHARIIAWLRDNSPAAWYDLGGTDGNSGLHQFKKGMVGTAGMITPVPPITNLTRSSRAYIMGNAAYLGRRLFHNARKTFYYITKPETRPDQDRSA